MKLIDKYIYNSVVIPSIFGIVTFTFILIINVLMEIMEKIFASDLPAITMLDYFLYVIPSVLTETIPMGAFLGVMLVYGGLSGTNELIAMESTGISLLRIMRPAIIFGFILTFIGLGLEIYVNPVALEKVNLQKQIILTTKPSSLTEEKVFMTNSKDGFGLYIDSINNEEANAKDFILLNKVAKDNPYPIVFYAKDVLFKPGALELQNVTGVYFDKDGNGEIAATYDTQSFPLAAFFNVDEAKKKSRSEMNLKELKEEYNTQIKIPEEKQTALKALVEYYKRLANPFSSLLLCWLGVLLSISHNRSGKGISFGISLIVIAMYIGINSYAKILVLKNNVPAPIAMWTANIILLIICVFLTFKKIRRN